ncbi:MAG: hypothetical protein NLN65_08290 [Candidatus Poseidoniaceae archaeon]|nr:hypothetical protein [Candidatus Poseidoniaceae archaeon]
MGSRSGGGSQSKENILSADAYVDRDGMTQTRGNNCNEQDKFRITLEVEQVCRGYFDHNVNPVADWGISSVILAGSHFRLANASPDRHFIHDDIFYVDGVEKRHRGGEPIPGSLGKALMDWRDANPVMYQEMLTLKFRFYQQPAGFDDSVTMKWKILEQAAIHGTVIGLRDLFAGALSDTSRECMYMSNQLSAWIRSKITAMIQVADTHVIRPLKIKKLQKDKKLRHDLQKLAESENTPVIFKCGMYEIMKTLLECVKELKEEWTEPQTLLKAMYQNGFLSVRPNVDSGKMEKTEGQAWREGFRLP